VSWKAREREFGRDEGHRKAQLPHGGRIVIDLSDVSYIDSSGLGALVGLKISAIKQGLVMLEFVNMAPRVLELMRITNIAQLLSS
jgi:anti-sigma B factor antagonist